MTCQSRKSREALSVNPVAKMLGEGGEAKLWLLSTP